MSGQIMRFRKKPVVVEAMRFEGGHSVGAITTWIASHTGGVGIYRERCLFIKTLEGEMEAMPGDWIIRGVKGEFYPCKPDIFAQTYELADPFVSQQPKEN
jgi:hypothetical protein